MSQMKRFLMALLALVLFIGSGTAQDGGSQYDLYLFKGDTTRNVNWTQAYVMEASIAEHYGSLMEALFALIPTSDRVAGSRSVMVSRSARRSSSTSG